MRIYELKVTTTSRDGRTFWKTIGHVFCGDDTHITPVSSKAATFVIDWPAASGILVPAKPKEDKDKKTKETNYEERN